MATSSTSSNRCSRRSDAPVTESGGIRAERLIARDPGSLFEFLSDLENHWRLADGFVEVLDLERDGSSRPAGGGRVKVKGPLGLRRIAVTRVLEVDGRTRLAGTAQIGRRTLARVSWTMLPENGGTRVRVAAEVERASLLDRALLAAGGARWMRRGFARILATLDGKIELDGSVRPGSR